MPVSDLFRMWALTKRCVFDECVTIREGYHHDQRVRFGGFAGREHCRLGVFEAGQGEDTLWRLLLARFRFWHR
jgi:hypothetical protein